MTFTLGDMIAFGIGIFTILGGICGTVIWLYSTFITRTEAAKMEQAVDRIIASFKQPIYDKLDKFELKLDKHLDAHH